MSLESDQTSCLDDELASDIPPRRRMRVRHSYPQSMIDLVRQLLFHLNARDVSKVLDVPLSSIYRWRHRKNSSRNKCPNENRMTEQLTDAIIQCERDGLRIPRSIIAMFTHDFDNGLSERKATPLLQNDTSIAQGGAPSDIQIESETDRRNVSDTTLRLGKALHAMRNQYFRDIDSTQLAGLAGMSRHHFIHTFSATHGISPHQYLLRVRIDAAKSLLLHSTETIDVIAAATGFRSGACLNRTFTRMEGHCISRFCRVVKNTKA